MTSRTSKRMNILTELYKSSVIFLNNYPDDETEGVETCSFKMRIKNICFPTNYFVSNFGFNLK